MTLSNHRWLFALVAALLLSLAGHTLTQNAKMEQRIYYYNGHTGGLVLETHRVKWSISPERNVCATVREQLLPAYSYDAIAPPHSFRLGACLFRRGRVYLNFTHDNPPPLPLLNSAEESSVHILQMVEMALRLNHHYIRQISINVNGLPWDSER